jgi:hypothetical protein
MASRFRTRPIGLLVAGLLVAGLIASAPVGAAPAATTAASHPKATFTKAVAFDVSPSMRVAAKQAASATKARGTLDRPERGPAVPSRGYAGDGALQPAARAVVEPEIPAPR